jgi:non-specific protein-tyrosine kinase
MRKPMSRLDGAAADHAIAGVGASLRLDLEFPQMIAAYDANCDRRTPVLSSEEKVFVDTFGRTGFTGGINRYRNISRNRQRSLGLDLTVRAPPLMIVADNDAILPPPVVDGMKNIIAYIEKYLIRDGVHWTQQEKPEEVSASLLNGAEGGLGEVYDVTIASEAGSHSGPVLGIELEVCLNRTRKDASSR